jgi:hypothetical protein
MVSSHGLGQQNSVRFHPYQATRGWKSSDSYGTYDPDTTFGLPELDTTAAYSPQPGNGPLQSQVPGQLYHPQDHAFQEVAGQGLYSSAETVLRPYNNAPQELVTVCRVSLIV